MHYLAVRELRHRVDPARVTGWGRSSRLKRGVGLVRQVISMSLAAYLGLPVTDTGVRGWGRVGPMFWARPPPVPDIPDLTDLTNIATDSTYLSTDIT